MSPIRTYRKDRIYRRLALFALLLGLCFGAVGTAGPATASLQGSGAATGSIVFTKGSNVWVSSPDGSRQRRLTKNGTAASAYSSPTQADNGAIVTLRANQTILRLARSGKTLGRPFKVAVGLRNAGPLHELAFNPAVSPDGTKVAVYKALLQGVYDTHTGVSGLNLLAVNVEYRSAVSGAKLGERHEPGSYLQSPSWIDNRRLLVFAPYNGFAPQVFVDTVGGGLQGWFADDLDGDTSFDRKLLDEGELTRAGDKLALIRGSNVEDDWRETSLTLYRVSAFSAPPSAACSVRATHGPLASPTWSPDGTTLAWSDASGIWVSPVDLGASGCGIQPRLVVPGGRTPDWGPAPAS